MSLLLLCACASDEERGCVTVKRHSKAGKVALQAAARWCVSEHRPVSVTELLELIGLYVGNMDDGHAAVKMAEVEAHIGDTWFAWVGGTADDAVFYYRILSPVILIEFDHQNPVGTLMKNQAGQPTRDHIHTVVRTPNGNDYGKDLLRQHLERHPH